MRMCTSVGLHGSLTQSIKHGSVGVVWSARLVWDSCRPPPSFCPVVVYAELIPDRTWSLSSELLLCTNGNLHCHTNAHVVSHR